MTKLGGVPYACKVCKIRRDNDVNHWFVLARTNEVLAIMKWNESVAAQPGAEHACGQDHAQILFSRWLATGSFEERK